VCLFSATCDRFALSFCIWRDRVPDDGARSESLPRESFSVASTLEQPKKKKYQEPNEITFETKETDKLDNKVSGGVEFSGR
jgi:hypothetical protein